MFDDSCDVLVWLKLISIKTDSLYKTQDLLTFELDSELEDGKKEGRGGATLSRFYRFPRLVRAPLSTIITTFVPPVSYCQAD